MRRTFAISGLLVGQLVRERNLLSWAIHRACKGFSVPLCCREARIYILVDLGRQFPESTVQHDCTATVVSATIGRIMPNSARTTGSFKVHF